MKKKTTKLIFKILLFGGTIISLFFVPWILVWAWILPLPDTVQDQLEQGIEHGFEGMIVYVDKAGEPSQTYTAGWHNREKKIPAKRDALFKIASIDKLYNAVAIAKLVHAKQLSLEKTLADYFPELVGRIENAEKITLRMMIAHRSGIPNFTNTPNFWNNPPNNREQALERVLDLPASFEPDTDYEYSNTNYLLIAELIQKEVGYPNFQFIKEEILTPLKLENTYASINEVAMDRVMSGYYVGVEEDIKNTNYGSMLATAEDVGIFIRALNNGSVFKEGEKEIYSSIYKFNHSGLIPGYQSIAEYHKDTDTVIVQFVNTTNFDGYTWNLAEIVYNRISKITANIGKDSK